MADKNTYRPETNGNLMNDPELKAFYDALSTEELRLADSISASVNEKISRLVDPAPFLYRYFTPLSIAFVGLMVLAAFLFWPHQNPEQDQMLSENSKKTNPVAPLTVEAPLDNKKLNHTEEQSIKESPASRLTDNTRVSHDNTTAEIKEEKNTLFTEENNTALKENTEKNKTEVLPDPVLKSDNTRNMVEEENKAVFLRVASAQVMSKVDLASISESRTSNTDVTNPQIGGKTITKSSSGSASLEDYPTHKGGDQGLSSYIARNLNNRIYIRKNTAVYNVNVSFQVNAKGKVEHVEVLDKVPAPMELEIKQVIENDTEWMPGKKSGKRGAIQVIVNISFYY